MSVRWEVDVERGLLTVAVVGAWMDAAESQGLREAIVPRGAWLVTRVLLDMREVDVASAPPPAELADRLRLWRDVATTPPRIALLGAAGQTGDFARLVEQLSTGIPIASFDEMGAALRWLFENDA